MVLKHLLPPRLPELEALEALLDGARRHGRVETLAWVGSGPWHYPIHTIVFGCVDPRSPILLCAGGVHGLERIGTQVVLSFLTTVSRQLEWDRLLVDALRSTRLAFVPLLNPVGMARQRRSNGNGVDLMRNAPPIRCGDRATPLVGGQRLSPRLPWFMGQPGAPMQPESQALVDFVGRQVLPARVAIALDVHSGFGMVDRLWFPYAHTRAPLPHLAEVHALKQLLDRTLPNHVYRMEPQSRAYTIRGDLWDHCYEEHRSRPGAGIFLPLTLELGSWSWVKKNPRQLLSALGSFNPVRPHRLRRALRRHLGLFQFLHHAVASPAAWAELHPARREELFQAGLQLWFMS